MKRPSILLAAVLSLCALVPAEADDALPRANGRLSQEQGRVDLAVVHPAAPRQAFNTNRALNGTVGWVFALPATADGDAYTLEIDSGLTGLENPDAYFYKDLPGSASGPGESCSRVDARDVDDDTETGTICPGSDVVAWGIVVLRTGARATFTFTY